MGAKAKGRPSNYSEKLANELCARLALGLSLRTVCKASDMPAVRTVFNWLGKHEDFVQQYTRAKEASADAMAEEILYITDTPKLGRETTVKPDGGVETKKGDMLGHRKLQVDTRKWLMAKLQPKKYGDKLDMTTNGKDFPTPILGGQSNADVRPNDGD